MGPETVFTEMPLEAAVIRLVAALLLGMVMGIEREVHGRPAGLRTHGLVSVGAALFTMLSIGMIGQRSDPGRIAAGVVTGIGFLGAGTIMRYGFSVYGLTTAASIWAAAAVGMTCGVGWLPAAIVATALILLTLALLRPVSIGIRPKAADTTIGVTTQAGLEIISAVASEIDRYRGRLHRVEVGDEEEGMQHVVFHIELPDKSIAGDLVAAIGGIEGVVDVESQ